MLAGCLETIACNTTSSKNVSSIEVPFISLVVAITKSLLTSGRVLMNLKAPISANVTPPMNITSTTFRLSFSAPACIDASNIRFALLLYCVQMTRYSHAYYLLAIQTSHGETQLDSDVRL